MSFWNIKYLPEIRITEFHAKQGLWSFWRLCGRKAEAALGIFTLYYSQLLQQEVPKLFMTLSGQEWLFKGETHFRNSWIQEKEPISSIYIFQQMTQLCM